MKSVASLREHFQLLFEILCDEIRSTGPSFRRSPWRRLARSSIPWMQQLPSTREGEWDAVLHSKRMDERRRSSCWDSCDLVSRSQRRIVWNFFLSALLFTACLLPFSIEFWLCFYEIWMNFKVIKTQTLSFQLRFLRYIYWIWDVPCQIDLAVTLTIFELFPRM